MPPVERGAVDSLGAICHYLSEQLRLLARWIFACLEWIAVTLGLMIYAAQPFDLVHPRVAWVSVLAMAMIAVLARLVKPLRRHVSWTRSFEIAALFIYAALMTMSMGAANTPFIALYAITLLAAALVWEVWAVTVLALITLGFTFLQTDYLDLMDEMPLFALAVVIFNALMPAAAAAVVIAAVRRLISVVSVGEPGGSGR